jgi:hypothetical protein
VAAQLAKISESQTLILAKFCRKAWAKSCWKTQDDKGWKAYDSAKELDYINAPSRDYTVEDLIKIITVKDPSIK